MPDDQTAGNAPTPWCYHCGQRHAASIFCDAGRLKQLEEWRAHLAAHRQTTSKGRKSNASTTKAPPRFWQGFGCGWCVGLFFGLIPTVVWAVRAWPR